MVLIKQKVAAIAEKPSDAPYYLVMSLCIKGYEKLLSCHLLNVHVLYKHVILNFLFIFVCSVLTLSDSK